MADGSDLVAVLLPHRLPLWTTAAPIGRLRCAAATSRRVTGRRRAVGRPTRSPLVEEARCRRSPPEGRTRRPRSGPRQAPPHGWAGRVDPPTGGPGSVGQRTPRRRSPVAHWVALGSRAAAGARAGQLVTAQVAAALVLVALGRHAPVVAAAALVAVLLVAAAWVPVRGRWLFEWLGTATGHLTRRRALSRAGRRGRTARPGRPGHRRPLDRVDRRAGGRPGGHHRHGRAPGTR